VRSRGEANAGFLGWVAKSEPFVSEVVARSVGVSYPAINASELVNINVPLPPLETQRRIALFLDEKTARIDALIAKKRALLDRLADKRQALITRAVTKGLSPDAPMKPSGIDWLGNIPAHWETAPLRWYLRTASGDGLRNEDVSVERTEADAIPVIGGNGLMGFTTSSNSSNSALVIGRVGALCGNVHPVAEPSWVTDNALKVYGIRGFVSFYLLQALKVRDLNVLASRNAQPLMTGEIVKAQIMPRPPIEEQAAIGAYVCAALDLLDRESNQITQSVELLREYRAATITAAVTAKIAPENVSEQGA
jgi:type I restriction enzyme S subunit